MIEVAEIRWIAEYRFCFRFSDNSVGACDLGPLLLKPRRTTAEPLNRDVWSVFNLLHENSLAAETESPGVGPPEMT
jgi:hypothetical protein